MSAPTQPAAGGEPSGPGAPTEGGQPKVDIDALADRVYRLMCREIRVERARGATSTAE